VQLLQRTPCFAMLSLVALMAAGCAEDRDAARQALAEIDIVVKQTSLDAPKYFPDRAAVVQREVAALRLNYPDADQTHR
jgi:hypothetical protein